MENLYCEEFKKKDSTVIPSEVLPENDDCDNFFMEGGGKKK